MSGGAAWGTEPRAQAQRQGSSLTSLPSKPLAPCVPHRLGPSRGTVSWGNMAPFHFPDHAKESFQMGLTVFNKDTAGSKLRARADNCVRQTENTTVPELFPFCGT